MNNKILRARTANQIDSSVQKVLADLGQREPPLDLEAVRRLLKIDKEYYRSTDPGMLREVLHSARLGGADIRDTVIELGQAILQWDIRAIFQPERRKILIDQDTTVHPEKKWRWSEAHEIAHSLMPWHGPLMKLDTMGTLSPDCVFDMEIEANYGAGRMLFLQDRFLEDAHSVAPTTKSIRTLASRYSNTITSTLWRYVESMDTPVFGMIGFHPTKQANKKTADAPCRYFIRSPKFIEQFADFSAFEAVDIFESYSNNRRGGPLGEHDAIIEDVNGDEHIFHFDSFFNSYEVLTLATYVGKHVKLISIGA